MPTGVSDPSYERRIVSVLFADLVGFTSLSERLDPEDVAAIQDRYFSAVRETVERYRGVLEKFIGDAAMAAFGVPRATDDDAERAVRCGLAIVGAIERLDAEVGLEPGALAVRVGVATGEVVHAETGPDAGRLTGDTVNTAARLQAAARPGVVLLSEPTALAVAEAIALGPAVDLELKGKSGRVRARPALGSLAVRSREAAMGGLHAPTVGREAELDRLIAAFERTRAHGSAERWLIVAPPGTGKTRLLEELAGRIVAGKVRRARFRPDDPRPFGALADLVPEATDVDLAGRLVAGGLAPGRAAVVAESLAGLASSTEDERVVGLDRDDRFRAWTDGLLALGAGTSELWVVEDAHWAGPDALAFLDAAHDRPGRGGWLVLASTRPSLLEREPSWSETDPVAGRHRLDLAGLSGGSSAELVGALVGDAIPAGLVRRIVEASDGNCLFIEELLRTWVSVGILLRDGSTWRMTTDPLGVAIPSTVHAVYGAQLDDLPPAARSAARRASVSGRRFPADALGALGVDESGEALASLDRRSLISGPADLPIVGPGYAYRHALLRDAAYASLARAERAALHVALARWLEAAAGLRVDEVAEAIGDHYESALRSASALAATVTDDLDRTAAGSLAAAWLERAAAHALRQAAHDAGAALLRRAIDLTQEGSVLDAARRWGALGELLRRAGRPADAAEAYRSALRLGEGVLADPSENASERRTARSIMAAAGSGLSGVEYEQLAFVTAWRLADDLLDRLGPGDDIETARLRLARGRARAGETNDAGPWIEDADAALLIARSTGDRSLELEVLTESAAARGEAGLPVMDDWRAVGELADQLGDVETSVRAAVNRAGYLLDERPAEVEAMLRPARDLAEAWALTERLAWLDYSVGEACLVTGDWARAVDLDLATLDRAETDGFHRVAVRTLSHLLPMASLTGRQDIVARGHAWYTRAAARTLPDSPYGRILNAAAMVCFGRAGLIPAEPPDPDRLRDGFGLESSGPAWLTSTALILGAWREAGRLEAAREALTASTAAEDRAVVKSLLAQGALALEDAAISARSGADPDAVIAAARSALGPLRRVGAAWWIARALRAIEQAGGATGGEISEAVAIERRLGLTGPAT